MKGTIILFLVVSFIVQLGGGIFIFKVEQYHVRKSIKKLIKEGVPNADLFTFTFSQNDLTTLEWKDDHEFKYQGLMYDIVRRHVSENGSEIFQCIADYQETLLFAKLDILTKKKISRDLPFQLPFEQLYKVFSRIVFTPFKYETPGFLKINNHKSILIEDLLEGFFNIILPPPIN